jgi:methionine-S-sulfoxide reductase
MNQTIVLGGGCFWCLEAVFQQVDGVLSVTSGYSGGVIENPTYRQVCQGSTGHAEVVEVIFDDQAISLTEILEIFFVIHDPTTLNRQGADVGTQYRSVVFYQTKNEQMVIEKIIQSFKEKELYNDPIVTQVLPLEKFYPAEEYHQNYYQNNPNQGYCQVVINPKLSKLKQKFASRLKH